MSSCEYIEQGFMERRKSILKLGSWAEANNSSPKKEVCYEMLHRDSDLNRFLGT
jgi:hypothetical protein